MQKRDAAAFLAGVSQTEGSQASAPTNLHVISGEVGTRSEDGKTTVAIDGLVFSEADDQYVEMDTLGGLEEGDVATIILTGEDGHAMTPLAIGAPGSVDIIRDTAEAADSKSDAAQELAQAAKDVADAVGQHFWTDENGIHVTEVTQDEWNDVDGTDYHSKANTLINSIGQLFRDGLNNLLTLTTENGARALTIWDGLGNAAENIRAIIGEIIQLGKSDESHVELDYHSMQMVDKEGNTYFHVSDLRGTDGYAALVEVIDNPDDGSYEIPVAFPPRSVVTTSVVIDPDTPDERAATVVSVRETQDGRGIVTVEEQMQEFVPVHVTYQTDADSAKAFTLGTRESGAAVGGGSFAAGRDVTASGTMAQAFGRGTIARGEFAHAEGVSTSAFGRAGHAEGSQSITAGDYAHGEGLHGWATGRCSHAQNNHTIAASADQTAMGRYNAIDSNDTYAFIIGNGSDANNRSNAFAVDWNGNVTANGQVSSADPYNSNVMRQLGNPTTYQNNGEYAITTAGIDTLHNGPRITIPAGSYIFVGQWTFNSASASGDRNMQVGFRSGASGSLWGERVRIRQSSGNFNALNVSALRTFTSETTVYLAGSASITSGKAGCYITAVRLN